MTTEEAIKKLAETFTACDIRIVATHRRVAAKYPIRYLLEIRTAVSTTPVFAVESLALDSLVASALCLSNTDV